MNDIKEQIKAQELRREIAHTILHRMNLRQFIFKGGFFRKEFDDACQKIIDLSKEIKP